MTLIKAILLGLIAGVTAFFPVSSTGSVMVAGHLLGLQMDQRLFMAVMTGLLAAMLLSYYRDLIRLLYSFGGIIKDLLYNLTCSLRFRRNRTADYRRILTGNYRNFFVLLLAAAAPALAVGLFLGKAVRYTYGSFLVTGLCFFVTAVILFVSSYMDVPEKGPKLMKPQEAVILGIFQGLAFLPGISKVGAISSAGFLCGVSRRLAVKFSYLLGMISLLAIVLPGKLHPVIADAAPSSAGVCIIGLAASFAGGIRMIRLAEHKITKENHRIFAGINIVLGMAALLIQMLMRV